MASRTITATDHGKILYNSGAIDISIPASTSGGGGTRFWMQALAGAITIKAAASITVNGVAYSNTDTVAVLPTGHWCFLQQSSASGYWGLYMTALRPTAAELTAGTETSPRLTSPANIKSMIDAHVPLKLTLTSGEAIAAGEWVYLKSDGKFWLADASAEATSFGWVGVSLTTTSGADEAMTAQKRGLWTTSGLTVGEEYFLSETAGAMTTTAPTADASVQRKVGEAISTTVLDVDVSYPPVTNGPSLTTITTKTDSYVFALTNADTIVESNASAGINFTVPTNASVAFDVGTTIDCVQISSAGEITITNQDGAYVNGVSSGSAVVSQGQWKGMSLYQRTADNWVVLGGA